MNRRIVFIFLALIMLVTIIFLYFNKIFLPVKIKEFVENKASAYLDRTITIEHIGYTPLKGMVLQNIRIFKQDDSSQPLAQIDEISFNIILAEFIKKKTVIIPNLKFKKPFITLIRDPQKTWNIPDLLNKASSAERFPSLIIRSIQINDGKVTYIDQTQTQEFSDSFRNLNGHILISLDKKLQFSLNGETSSRGSTFAFKGDYRWPSALLVNSLKLKNFYPLDYLWLYFDGTMFPFKNGYITSADLNQKFNQGQLKSHGNIDISNALLLFKNGQRATGNINLRNTQINWHDNKLDMTGQVLAPAVTIFLGADQEINADISGDIQSLSVHDNNFSIEANLTMDNANIQTGKNQNVQGKITAQNFYLEMLTQEQEIKAGGNLNIEGAKIQLDDMILHGNLKADKTSLAFRDQSLRMITDLTMRDARLDLPDQRQMTANIDAPETHVTFVNNQWTVSGNIAVHDANLPLTTEQKFLGNTQIKLSFEYNPYSFQKINYSAAIHFENDTLTGVPRLGDINAITGTVNVIPDQLQTDGLSLIAHNSDLSLSGILTDFAHPAIQASLVSDKMDLNRFSLAVPELLKKIEGNINGQASAVANYKGPLARLNDSDFGVTLNLKNATLDLKKLGSPIKGISGQLDFKNDYLAWQNLRIIYNDTAYALTGNLTRLPQPLISTTVSSEKLALSSQWQIVGDTLRINSFSGHYFNSSFSFQGSVSSWTHPDPLYNIEGKATLALDDLPLLLPQWQSSIDPLKPTGSLALEGSFSGRKNNWRDWQLTLTGQASQISLNQFPFNNTFIEYKQSDRTVSQFDIVSEIYDGKLMAFSSVDLSKETPPIDSVIQLNNLDLMKYRKEHGSKIQPLSGKLSTRASLTGPLTLPEQLTGEGTIDISNGYLGQLIPQLEEVIYTSAHADFTVRDKKFITENGKIMSSSMDLNAKGWIDFSKNINFDIEPGLHRGYQPDNDTINIDPTSALTRMVHIKLTGTLDHPVKQVNASPKKIIEGTTGVIKEGIGTILEEIF